jgi:hypothetical protein
MLWHTALFDSIALNGTSTVSDLHVEIGSPGEECSVTEALKGSHQMHCFFAYIPRPSYVVVYLQTSAFTPSLSSPLQIILFNPIPTGTPTNTAPARTNHLTTPLACARCSSLIVWPSTRRCSIPSFVEESSEIKWPKEALPRDGLCWALAQEDSSMGARFFWEYEREGCDFDA